MAAQEECVRASRKQGMQWALELKAETSRSDKVDGLVGEERRRQVRDGATQLCLTVDR